MSVCVLVRSGPVNPTSLKRLKLWTSNLTSTFPGTVEDGVWPGHVTSNVNSSKAVLFRPNALPSFKQQWQITEGQMQTDLNNSFTVFTKNSTQKIFCIILRLSLIVSLHIKRLPTYRMQNSPKATDTKNPTSYLVEDCPRHRRLWQRPQRAGHASLPGPTAPLVTELLQLPVLGYGTVYCHSSKMRTYHTVGSGGH